MKIQKIKIKTEKKVCNVKSRYSKSEKTDLLFFTLTQKTKKPRKILLLFGGKPCLFLKFTETGYIKIKMLGEKDRVRYVLLDKLSF